MRLAFLHKVLIAAAAAFAGVVGMEILFGMHNPPGLDVASTTRPVPRQARSIEEPPAFRLRPRNSFRAFVERPLFESSRQSVPETITEEESTVEIVNVRLLGIVMTASESIAILRAEGSVNPVRARVGDSVAGWRVARITEDSVLLRNSDSEKRVSLPYGG